ncbi:MAG: polymer-forming cytoskeletal protein [Hyphomicrobiaceae bacterium]|nr:polymer-forming cytoskeletal protein [Hyphomicrobiaceae bacterium]
MVATNGLGAPASKRTSDLSVISNDLQILGQDLRIVTEGRLQVDGHVEGDIHASEVIIGEKGQVSGLIAGEQITVLGNVSGALCAKVVKLSPTSAVTGDVHHMSFVIEQGAMFEGRSRRVANETELKAVAEANRR